MAATENGRQAASETRKGRRLIWLTVFAYVCILLGAGGLLITHEPDEEWAPHDAGTELVSVRVSSPVFHAVAVPAGFLGLATLSVVAVINIRCRHIVRGLFACGAVLVLLVGGWMWSVCHMFGGIWTVDSRVTAPNGQTYYFLDANELQDSTLALATRRPGNPVYATYDVLGTGEWHDWAPIIPPSGTGGDYDRLYVNDEGLIVGIHAGDHCVFAYDTQTGRFYDGDAVKELSRFVLTGRPPEMHEPRP